jgi:hypothetical protein
VDHQVEHHIHVERTRRENAQAVHFEEHRFGEQRQSGANCGIEALEVPDLHNAIVPRRDCLQLVGLSQSAGQWLLDENIHAVFHQLARNGEMRDGRNRDGHCIHPCR